MLFTDCLLHALEDTARLLPFLFLTYLVMEYLEQRAGERSARAVRRTGRLGPLAGAALGAVPQCGFSAAASSLYSGGLITAGTLMAVFLSTSDEMLPIFISEAVNLGTILKILGTKAALGAVTGFLLDLLIRRFRKKEVHKDIHDLCEQDHCHCEEGSIVKSALRHTLQIALFLLVISLAIELAIHLLGEEALSGFLTGKPVLGVFLAALVGLIPNCASSVILTELYLAGSALLVLTPDPVALRDGRIVSGIYQEGTHKIVPVDSCLIEDQTADSIIRDIRGLLASFKIKIYNEDSGYGLLRHVLIRRGFATGQVLVALVLASPILPSKNNFVKALRKLHPEITTVVLNVNDKKTSMVLGERNITLYGKGYIEDILCGKTYRISPGSFYQVNPVQTEVLYRKAIELAGLTGRERVLDAYCGIGTIGMTAADQAGEVIGVELNRAAVRDAISNAKANGVKNIRFFAGDAGDFLDDLAARGETVDVVFLDPPRAGSTEKFLNAVARMGVERVVYVSCNPETLARDLKYLKKKGYQAEGAWVVDMFPWTESCECVVKVGRK